jgi:hypothetical protein
VSAFHGDNALVGNLGVFLQAIRDNKVLSGSALIVESVDRISRQGIDVGYDLCKSILKAGIHIITLSPERDFGPEAVKGLTKGALELQLILERAAEESAMKSERVGATWSEKKAEARQNRSVQTSRLPAWLEVVGRQRVGKYVRGGELRPIPQRVAVVKRIFALACSGYGLGLIVKQLTNDGVAPMGGKRRRSKDGKDYTPEWSKAYVRKILTGRAVLGEYQPRKGTEPEGPPIPDYYPVVVDEETWHRAQGALASRKDKPGRIGAKTVSLFAGLLWDASTTSRMLIAWQTRGSGKNRQKVRALVSAGSMEGRSPSVSFPYPIFEQAILSLLKEVNPADVIGEEPEGESVALSAEVASVEKRLREIEEELIGDGSDVPALVRVAKALEQKHQDLLRRLAETQQREANPRGTAWTDAQTLLDVAKDEPSCLRLRGLLRTIIQDIQMVIVPGCSIRLAAVQINFHGGSRRDYLIGYKPARRGVEGAWWARSNLAEVLSQVEVHLQPPGDSAGTFESDQPWSLSLTGGDLHDPDEVGHTVAYLQSLTPDLLELIFRDCTVSSTTHP